MVVWREERLGQERRRAGIKLLVFSMSFQEFVATKKRWNFDIQKFSLFLEVALDRGLEALVGIQNFLFLSFFVSKKSLLGECSLMQSFP